jgi:hypothetical protein
MSDARAIGTVAVVGIYATFALDCYSTFCSSPQTTELNAKARADTLMKWVTLGGAVAVAGGTAASVYSGSWAPLIGAGVITVLMYACYVHAKNAGLADDGEPTESY